MVGPPSEPSVHEEETESSSFFEEVGRKSVGINLGRQGHVLGSGGESSSNEGLLLPSTARGGRRQRSYRCDYNVVAETHSPSYQDEKGRIEPANGWITTEKEIPVRFQ